MTARQSARASLDSGIRLALITAMVVGLLTVLHELTREPIAQNRQMAQVALLAPLIDDPSAVHGLANSLAWPQARDLRLCDNGVERFRLIRDATDGYSGSIDLVMVLDGRGGLLGVRVLGHTETPGLGDAVEPERSDWIHQFSTIQGPLTSPSTWRLQPEGGQIDAISGATITSRAVINGVARALGRALQNDAAKIPCTPLGLGAPIAGTQDIGTK